MKRRRLIIAIFLLLGAVVNVAVAWGLARYFDPVRPSSLSRSWTLREIRSSLSTITVPMSRRRPLAGWQGKAKIEHYYGGHPGDGQYWDCATSKRFGTVTLHARAYPHWLPAPFPVASIPHWSRLRAPQRADHPHAYLFEFATGWPMLAMVYRRERFPGGPRMPVFEMISMGLPTEVIWTGFLVNTLLYAALLWLLTCGPFVLRRFLRVRRGLCPKCAYPMGESAVCTECGKPLPS